MKPNVAIIISNYNYGPYVIEAIESAINQTYTGPLRVYVLDDGSSDDSWEKISAITESGWGVEELDTKYYKGPIERRQGVNVASMTPKDNLYAYKINNSGASTARNVAMWEAWEWSDIFGILDADDLYKPNKVEVLVDKLMEYPEVGVAYADYRIHRQMGHHHYTKYEIKSPYSRELLLQKCIVHSGSLVKKEYLEQIILPLTSEFFDSRLHGPGSQSFIGCTEDYDLWIRLSKVCMITHVAQPLSIVRETGQNQSLKMTPETFQQNAQILQTR